MNNVKVIDYSLVESDNQAELVEAVAAACVNDNWYPCGGICVWFQPVSVDASDELRFATAKDSKVHYAQALVKYGPA